MVQPGGKDYVMGAGLDRILDDLAHDRFGSLRRRMGGHAKRFGNILPNYCAFCRKVYCDEHFSYSHSVDGIGLLEEEIEVCPRGHTIYLFL